jgi:hypothetical protein
MGENGNFHKYFCENKKCLQKLSRNFAKIERIFVYFRFLQKGKKGLLFQLFVCAKVFANIFVFSKPSAKN